MGRSIRLCAILIAALVASPRPAAAQDRWLAADKAKHFGATTAISVSGYALAAPVTTREKWRIVAGTSTGIGAAAAKEMWDRSHGDGSWRDFAWGAAGTTLGVLIARAVDKMWGS